MGLRPLVEELGDEPVEVFVAGPLRLMHIVVDVAEGHYRRTGSCAVSSPHSTSRARLAVGKRWRTRARNSVPLMSGIHWSASTRATSSPAALNSPSLLMPHFDDGTAITR